MAHFCKPEKEGQEVERVPSGVGAPKKVNISSHGVLYSGRPPNPERKVQSSPWFRLSAAPAGQPITKVILMVYMGSTSVRGAF